MSELDAALWKPPPTGSDEPDALMALKAVPLFADLNERELRKVLRLVHERAYLAGEVIFRQGDPGAGMFVIRRGKVRIVAHLGAQERELVQLSQHQFFGEMALLEDAPRSASCVSVEPTEVLGFFAPDLESLVARDSVLGAKILFRLAQLMATRLRVTNQALKQGSST
jgi:CRP/FNR family transcriptional regulator, cyclic AMP receptor protein